MRSEPITVSFDAGNYNVGESPKELRKRARRIEKDRKAAKRERRERKAQRHAAIDALVRVAADKSKGYASVQAAEKLLNLA